MGPSTFLCRKRLEAGRGRTEGRFPWVDDPKHTRGDAISHRADVPTAPAFSVYRNGLKWYIRHLYMVGIVTWAIFLGRVDL